MRDFRASVRPRRRGGCSMSHARCRTLDVARSMSHARCRTLDVARSMSLARCRSLDVARSMSLARCRSLDVARSMSPARCRSLDVARSMSLARCRSLDVARSMSLAHSPLTYSLSRTHTVAYRVAVGVDDDARGPARPDTGARGRPAGGHREAGAPVDIEVHLRATVRHTGGVACEPGLGEFGRSGAGEKRGPGRAEDSGGADQARHHGQGDERSAHAQKRGTLLECIALPLSSGRRGGGCMHACMHAWGFGATGLFALTKPPPFTTPSTDCAAAIGVCRGRSQVAQGHS